MLLILLWLPKENYLISNFLLLSISNKQHQDRRIFSHRLTPVHLILRQNKIRLFLTADCVQKKDSPPFTNHSCVSPSPHKQPLRSQHCVR